MRKERVHVFWIVAAATVISFTNLGGAALWDEDETLYASCAREMLERDDWVVPYFNGQMFPDKPPLMFWTMMLGFKLFGINELGARFLSAVFAVAMWPRKWCTPRPPNFDGWGFGANPTIPLRIARS